ncbi:hypothetical protein P4S70_13725 [Enterovibrio sp. Hal110]
MQSPIVAKNIVDNARLALDAELAAGERINRPSLPEMIGGKVMARFMVTPEMKGWLTTNWPKLSLQALTLAFNQRFDLEKTEGQVKGILKTTKLRCGRNRGQVRKGQYRYYTNEQAEFIRDGYPKWTIPELTSEV